MMMGTVGTVLYKLDPTLAPVRPCWSLPRSVASREGRRRPAGSVRRGR
jgi:hypothetical protein